jgi:hypothetical protein
MDQIWAIEGWIWRLPELRPYSWSDFCHDIIRFHECEREQIKDILMVNAVMRLSSRWDRNFE